MLGLTYIFDPEFHPQMQTQLLRSLRLRYETSRRSAEDAWSTLAADTRSACVTGTIWPATNMDAETSADNSGASGQSAPTSKRNQVAPAGPGSTVTSGGVSLPPPPLAPGMQPGADGHTSYTQNAPPTVPQVQMGGPGRVGGSPPLGRGGANGERADMLPPLSGGASGDGSGYTPREPLPQVGVHQTPQRTANPAQSSSQGASRPDQAGRPPSSAKSDYARLAEQKASAVSDALAGNAEASAAGASRSSIPPRGGRKGSIVVQAAAGASRMLQRAGTWVRLPPPRPAPPARTPPSLLARTHTHTKRPPP